MNFIFAKQGIGIPYNQGGVPFWEILSQAENDDQKIFEMTSINTIF